VSTRPQLEGPIHAVPVDEGDKLRRENVQLQNVLRESRVELERMAQSVDALLSRLRPLHQILNAIFDGAETSVSSAPTPSSSTPAPHNRAAWEAWKQQLPDACGRIIDALFVQPLTASQLATVCKAHYSTMTAGLRILERNSLIEKDGKRNRLKRL
jgi:hypothetical protein